MLTPTSASQKIEVLPTKELDDGVDSLTKPSGAFLLDGILQERLQGLEHSDHVLGVDGDFGSS